jgi:phosphatidylglycerophosphate synthase
MQICVRSGKGNKDRNTILSPTLLTTLSFVLCVGAGVAAWRELWWIAVGSWLVGRTLDGLDGTMARACASASDTGGYADILLDTIGYAAVPLGIAFAANDIATWQVVAVLLATFYANAVSWLMLSALLEKNAAGASTRGEQTSITMPVALIEGTETIVFFTVALAIASVARTVFIVMAIGVIINIFQRSADARRLL